MTSLKFKNKRLIYLDQTKLPNKEVWIECRSILQGYKAIKELKVRGAPLIGVFASYCICIHIDKLSTKKDIFLKQLKASIDYLSSCRPTAVNLGWALERIWEKASETKNSSLAKIKENILKETQFIHKEDISLCKRMSFEGLKLINKGDRILTHCNTGFLATSGCGTALGIIHQAKKQKKSITVYVDETRPLLQGSRLTMWELYKNKIKAFLVCDNTAAYLMQERLIDKVFVGADRIASNADTANKIGTYNVAILSKYHKIPFYVVAPSSSFDLSLKSGRDIPIESRPEDEIKKVLGKVYVTSKAIKAKNLAFDITPHKLITAIVTDKGIIYPPFSKNIKRVLWSKKS